MYANYCFALFVQYTNNSLLLPNSRRPNDKKWYQYSVDGNEDTIETKLVSALFQFLDCRISIYYVNWHLNYNCKISIIHIPKKQCM